MSCRRRRAFSLLELVLAILGVVTAIAVPSLRGFARGRRVDDCAAQIASLARWARTQAITRGVTYRLNVDATSRTYWLTAEADGGVERLDPVGEEFGRVFRAPDGVTIDWPAPGREGVQSADSVHYVRFLPTGRTDPAVIRLTDPAAGGSARVVCRAAAEPFHVVSDRNEDDDEAPDPWRDE